MIEYRGYDIQTFSGGGTSRESLFMSLSSFCLFVFGEAPPLPPPTNNGFEGTTVGIGTVLPTTVVDDYIGM